MIFIAGVAMYRFFLVAMENLTPTIIKRRWADEVDDDEYASDGCHNGEDAICKTGVSTVHVDQLRAVAAALLDISSDAPKQQEGCVPDSFRHYKLLLFCNRNCPQWCST